MSSSDQKTLTRPTSWGLRRRSASRRKTKRDALINARILKAAAELKARQIAGQSADYIPQEEAARRLAAIEQNARKTLKKSSPKK